MPDSPSLFKLLSHPQRLAILRSLMASKATLTQLGERFHASPAHIRHHLKLLETAGLVEFVESRPVQGGPEKYYRATRHALLIHETILPTTPGDTLDLTLGSIDTAVRQLAGDFSATKAPIFINPIPLSSLDGLIALRQGLCQVSASHLVDPLTCEYNRTFVRHLFPGQPMALIRLFTRLEGLIVQPGNPLGIASLADLSRPEVRFINREIGSGVRQWLDQELKQLAIPTDNIPGYQSIARSHNAVARHVSQGSADLGLGLASSAHQFGLDFIPIYEEPYELVLPQSLLDNEAYAPFFAYLNSGAFRQSLAGQPGYALSQSAPFIERIQ